jgi:NADH-quinone oxidoreductase subunit J
MPADVVFAVLAGITLFGAIVAVGAASLFRAALGLMLSLFGVAGLFLLQRAEFLAVVQVLVYVGGVSVLIVFAILLTEREGGQTEHNTNRRMAVPAALLAAGFAIALAGLISGSPVFAAAPDAATWTAASLGRAFVGMYLVPFEAVSLLLLVALVGALLIARED